MNSYWFGNIILLMSFVRVGLMMLIVVALLGIVFAIPSGGTSVLATAAIGLMIVTVLAKRAIS